MIIRNDPRSVKQKRTDENIRNAVESGVVPIRSSDIYWKLHSRYFRKGREQLVSLQWGWTAGLTEKELKRLASDAPRGHSEVVTTLRMARELRDDLNRIIQEHKELPPRRRPILSMKRLMKFMEICKAQKAQKK